MQDALQALRFGGQQTSEADGLQGDALHVLGAERPLGDHGLGLTLQSDHGLVDGVDPGAAGSINYSQALLRRNTSKTYVPSTF